MSGYVGANSVAEKIGKLYWGDGASLAQVVQKAYVGDPRGVAELWYQRATPLGSLSVGSLVYLAVGGKRTPWLVVHQGLPGDMYDASCNGTWLLMQDIYQSRQWHSSNANDYEKSAVHAYLNSTFLNQIESNVKDAIKQVKLPYRKGSGTFTTVTSGSNGLPAKIFLLSATETSFSFSSMPRDEGAELAYFKGCADNGSGPKRVAYLDGSATYWWLRSPSCSLSGSALYVGSYGDWSYASCSTSRGIRPALVLPQEVLVDKNNNVVGG